MKRIIRVVVLSAWVAALFGCSDRDIRDVMDDLEEVRVAQTEVFCGCFADPDPVSQSECMQDGTFTADERECADEILGPNEERVLDAFECIVELEHEFLTCIQYATCDDLAEGPACSEWRDSQLETCPPIPEDVQEALFECRE